MKYPFDDYETAESFIEAIESNPNGHYPIGTSMFWHSGVHIFCDSQKEFEPLISGKVVCYRISEDYKHVELPASLGKEELEGRWSDYKEFYDKEGRIRADCTNETYPISDCFILLEHTISINGDDFTFHTLYMNLAPACDNKNYKKPLIMDGAIHGNAINPAEESFFVDKIGLLLPAKDKKQIYFDLVVLSKQSIEGFSSKDAGIKAFWGIKENTPFYQIKQREKVMAVKTTLPSWAYFTETKYQDGGSVSYEIRITHIHVYLPKSAIDETGKLEQLSEITFADRNQKIFEPSSDLEFICGKVQPILNKLKGRKVTVVDDISKISDEALYVVDKSDFRYIKLAFDEPVIFWTTEPIKSQYVKGISANQCVEKYEKNPCSFIYIMIMKNDVPDELKKEVKDISEIATHGADGKNYYKVEFGIPQSEEYFVRESDRDACMESLLNFKKWFYFCKKSDSIICDRTELIKNIIEKHDTTVRKAMLMMPIIGIWWTGSKLTWKLLKYVYGWLSSKNDSLEGMLTKAEVRKAVCGHPIEWDKNQFSKLKEKNLGKSAKKRLENEAAAIDLWNGGLEKIFSDSPYFYHPIYFISHLEKAKLFEFNPYAGMKYKDVYGYEGDASGINMDAVITGNPGFAPVWTERSGRNPNINGYACITGFFNEDYSEIHKEKYKYYYHEGIDFRGSRGTEVVSLVYGKIIEFGKSRSMQGTVLMQAKNDVNLYYLAVHLDENSFSDYALAKGKEIKPGDKIAKIGIYPTGDHLHVSVIKLENGESSKNACYLENGICRFPTWSCPEKMKNPFDYDSSWKGNEKKKEQ
ncbi:MAG: M23 family metallopeptidase [Treponemataceae bacterium]|nr:M23 family metallopeptidase [Treponemataceae bacterium]